MQKQLIQTREECLAKLQELGIKYTMQEHVAVMNMQELIAATTITSQMALVKNLFYVDKKDNFFYIMAHTETNVGKQFWKSLGLASGNMRMTKPEQLEAIIKSQKGSLNPFSLYNDSDEKVKKIIIDEKLFNYSEWGLHPTDNTATVFVNPSELREKFLKQLKKEVVVISLQDEQQLVAEVVKQQKPVEEQKQQQILPQSEESVQQLSITVKKGENFSRWYQQVITKSEMIEYYEVSGCYILRPWAFSIWDSITKYFDNLIQEVGVENTYFPMFVTERALNKEKEHVEGFAPEVAWVTKYGDSDLKERIAIRPTSETIMYPAFAKWIKGHRDLPLKLNQWTNIVRWEFKFPTPFIRTREFLWQEGHTAHATEQQATEQVYQILEFYAQVYEDLLAVPIIKGIKTESEKFAGGYFTTSIETIIPQNGRGVQAATSHQLGQNFSKMFDIQFEDEKREKQYAWQTSWGLTTRSIGTLIMFHGDDKGLVLPPKVSKYQVVIVPILFKGSEQQIIEAAQKLGDVLRKGGIRTHVDIRDNYNPGWKYNHWEQKGVPIRFELGPKDIEKQEVRVVQRFDGKKYQLNQENVVQKTKDVLEQIQLSMFNKAKSQLDSRIKKANDWNEFMNELNQQNTILTLWCQDGVCEKSVKTRSGIESKEQDVLEDGQVQLTGAAKTLCIPLHQDPIQEGDKCFACGQQAKKYVLWGRTY